MVTVHPVKVLRNRRAAMEQNGPRDFPTCLKPLRQFKTNPDPRVPTYL